MRPFHGYAQIMVAGAPSTWPYQHIMLSLGQELAVDTFYIVRHVIVVGGGETLIIFHVNHILHVFANAMTQGIM